jgi:FtsP/CotA-like multicopper oxidase with cupredoxin domain
MAHRDLRAGTYSGQFAFVHVDRRNEPGDYDREFFLASHEWEPSFINQSQEDKSEEQMHHLRVDKDDEGDPGEGGWEVRYRWATLNGRTLGFGEPLRVRQGERVLFHLLNASATENVRLALPGHVFTIRSLDSNRIPRPCSVPVIELGVGERVDAIVEMKAPGVWVLGATDAAQRLAGLGIVVEYAGCQGEPVWTDTVGSDWDYNIFAHAVSTSQSVMEEFTLRIARGSLDDDGFERWTILTDSGNRPPVLRQGCRYRLNLRNESDEWHPMHLHRHAFEITRFRGKSISGLVKDTVVVPPYEEVALDLTPRSPGPALFHCHNQLHMDAGLQMLLNVE